MEAPSSPEEEWDKDTDDINSLDSEELHETRPNRWTGAQSTWRLLTEQDRSVYTALERQRDRDLSIHLYNAFALKRKRRSGPEAGLEDEDEHDESDWMPNKNWTAWPLPPGQVPDANLSAETGGDDEAFTVRNPAPSRPGALLEDAIAATMLRMAKERFRRRKGCTVQDEDDHDTEADASSVDTTAGNASQHEAVPSADDDLSYRLLRPAARRVMGRLDAMLAVLHNTRAAAVAAYQSESSDAGEQVDPEGSTAAVLKPKPKSTLTPTAGSNKTKTKRRGGGRPRKVHVPLPGETEHEMLVRVAREQKKRMPVAVDHDAPATRKEPTRRPPCTKPTTSHSPRRPPLHVGKHQQKRISKLATRDWRDVVGAAALAGFPHDVVARTAQRCASLFGEPVVLHELAEMPARRDVAAGTRTTLYEPGIPDAADDEYGSETAEEAEDEDEHGRGRQPRRHIERLRSLSRHSHSRATASSSSDEADSVADADADADRGRASRRPSSRQHSPRPPSRRRSRSATPGGLCHYCPHLACPRAVEGFPRKGNLVRHIRLVHGDKVAAAALAVAAAAAGEHDGEVDSADEVDGAVHVDGFLKPIVMRNGWRGADAVQRKPRTRSKKGSRGRTRERDGERKSSI